MKLDGYEWCKDFANVHRLAHYLIVEREIDDVEELYYFYGKPWEFNEEYKQMLSKEQQ